MMHSGKINYVVQHLLGYEDIGQVMGYSEQENDWCKKNEKDIWEYICANDHLHARDPMVIRYYMKPAPTVEDVYKRQILYMLLVPGTVIACTD